MSDDTRALIPAEPEPPRVIRALEPIANLIDAAKEFEALKMGLCTPDDWQTQGDRSYLKKSGYRKLAAAFGLSLTLLEERYQELQGGGFTYHCTVRAAAPGGRHADGVGTCSSSERRFAHPQHDVRSIAYTRACNRSISDLIGGGEVSADELTSDPPSTAAQPSYIPPSQKDIDGFYGRAAAAFGLDRPDVDVLFSCAVSQHTLPAWLQLHQAQVGDAGRRLKALLDDHDERQAFVRALVHTLGILV